MRDFKFRPIMDNDVKTYASWFNDSALSSRVSEPTEAWIAYIRSGEKPMSWAVLNEDVMVGEIQVDYYPDQTCSIAIVVDPHRQSQGIGPAMLQEFVEKELSDHDRIDAYIEDDNLRSKRCFAKAGFKQVSDKPDQDEMVRFSFIRKPAETHTTLGFVSL